MSEQKPVAKTPDVRKALAKIVYKYSYEPEPFTEFKQALEDFIKPLIEAAKIERDDEWRDIVTTFITSSTKRMESHLGKTNKDVGYEPEVTAYCQSCGCYVRVRDEDKRMLEYHYCDMHGAAFNMYRILDTAIPHIKEYLKTHQAPTLRPIIKSMENAINKADGK